VEASWRRRSDGEGSEREESRGEEGVEKHLEVGV
jgi:hypothetical protein